MSVTYYVVVPFDRDDDGDLRPGEAQEVPNPGIAERKARDLATAPCRRCCVLPIGRSGHR